MGQPSASDVHVDAPLTNISIAYKQDAENFVSGKVFPEIGVAKQSDKYFVYDRGDFRRNEAAKRAAGSESAGGGFDMTTSSYSCDVYAFHKDVDDQVRGNADAAVDPEEDASRFVMEKLLIQREVDWSSSYFGIGIWDTDVVGGTNFDQWDDASSDPEKDIDDAKLVILKATGSRANTFVVSEEVHIALKRHPLIVERYKHTSSESITREMIARFLEIDNYYVAGASYNTAAEDAADVDAFIMGKNALLCHVAPSPGLLTPSSGYTFTWTGLTGMNNVGIATSVIDMRGSGRKVDRVESEFAYDHKVVSTIMGYFFSAAVS